MTRALLVAGLSAALAMSGVSSLRAQDEARPRAARPGFPRQPLPRQPAGLGGGAQRQMVEQRIRQQLWQVAKTRIGFSDEQMTRLEQVSQRYDVRRRALNQQERAQRETLRGEIVADSAANQATIAAALDQIHQIQRQRVEMLAEEQREWGAFMTPLQRAKYMALQEQLRRRLQELLKARADSLAVQPPL